MLLIPALCLVYLSWLAGSGALLVVPFVVPVFLWRMRREKQEAVPLRIAPGPEPVDRELSDEERKQLRTYFERLALFYAVMLDRAGSEMFLKEKVLPEGFEVTSRRTHLDLLKKHGLWEAMAQRDRDAVMMADGHWEWWQINHVSLAIEQLRLVRWILRKDFYLPLIGQQLRADYGVAHGFVLAPEKVLNGKGLVEIASMRDGAEAADHYFLRCWAEGISRGYFEANGDEAVEWANSVSERLRGKQHEDVVLGGKLVSEVSEQELRWATSLAERRRLFLRWAMQVMEEGKAPAWEMSVFPTVREEVGVEA
jgi:hypothetical protein